jgi:hypothetical protein
MDQNDLDKVSAIVKKLNSCKAPELPKLSAAIDQAMAELNKYTAGGPISAAWTKMKGLVGIDNPVVKITTFADALEKGFSQIPTILKNNGISLQNADLSKSLSTLLATPAPKSDLKRDEKAGASVLGPEGTTSTQNEAEAPKGAASAKLKSVVAQLQKALSPGGIFGAFKKVPYISSQELAQELVLAPIKVFANVAKTINQGSKAAEIAPDLKATIIGQGQAQTKGVDKVDPTKKAQQSQPPAPSKPSTVTSKTTPTGEVPPKPQGGGSPSPAVDHKRIHATIQRLMKNTDPEGFVKALMSAGLDPKRLGVGQSATPPASEAS